MWCISNMQPNNITLSGQQTWKGCSVSLVKCVITTRKGCETFHENYLKSQWNSISTCRFLNVMHFLKHTERSLWYDINWQERRMSVVRENGSEVMVLFGTWRICIHFQEGLWQYLHKVFFFFFDRTFTFYLVLTKVTKEKTWCLKSHYTH